MDGDLNAALRAPLFPVERVGRDRRERTIQSHRGSRTGRASLLLAFGIGIAVATALGLALLLQRSEPVEPVRLEPPISSASPVGAATATQEKRSPRDGPREIEVLGGAGGEPADKQTTQDPKRHRFNLSGLLLCGWTEMDERETSCGFRPADKKTDFCSQRFHPDKDLAPGAAETQLALAQALQWLAEHQDEDGRWDGAHFMKHDPESDKCDGQGRTDRDIGITAIALLAFLGDGHTTRKGLYKQNVSAGIKWLRRQQELVSGRIGEESTSMFLHDHALATLALCEAVHVSYNPLSATSAEQALDFLAEPRNPDGSWSASGVPSDQGDLVATTWALFAFKVAVANGAKVDQGLFTAALAWIDGISTGVTQRGIGGTLESKPKRVDSAEATAATALLCRDLLGQNPATVNVMHERAGFLLGTLRNPMDIKEPRKQLDNWYTGSYAMFQMGGEAWLTWKSSMELALLASRRTSGSTSGSWDPSEHMGSTTGRVYATALGALCMEVEYRYTRRGELRFPPPFLPTRFNSDHGCITGEPR